MRFSPRLLPLTALLAVGLLGGPARAATPEIRDDGKFFDAATIREATRLVDQIEHKYKRDVVVETFSKIPADLEAPDKSEAGPFFRRWATERAEHLRVNGIYILICKSPSRFQVEVGNQTRKIFPDRDERELERILMENLKEHKPDTALLEGLRHIETTFGEHERTGTSPVPARGQDSGIMGWVCMGLAVLVGIWLVFALVRAFSGMGGGGGGGGGGGFFPSLLGGMFGAAAGMWMYDSFFGHGGSSAFGGGDTGTGGGLGQDTDYSGGGGDFGGGDSGGDTGGGGDFGGDSGGGGDFGGGGDW